MISALTAAINGTPFESATFRSALQTIFKREATPAQIGALLIALRLQGEGAEQLAVGAAVMREYCLPVTVAPRPVLLDTCGTGGDGLSTFNISTAAAIVIAACGVAVAKHGNRAASSRSGSADVLDAMGVRVDLAAQQVSRCIDELGIGFMLARRYHPGLAHVAQVRSELGVRTIFNLLGPLSNPAGATHQVVGVPGVHMLLPFAQALSALGARRAWVVSGHGGMDELALTGPTHVMELHDGELREFVTVPENFGLRTQPDADLSVASAGESAAVIRGVLRGDRGAARDVVVLNAAAGLIVAGCASSLEHAAQLAEAAISSGAALRKFVAWATFTHAV